MCMRGPAARSNIVRLPGTSLVSQAEPRVEVFRRQPGGHWLLSEAVGLDAVCHFESLDCAVPLAEIYAKVIFSPDGPLVSIRPAN